MKFSQIVTEFFNIRLRPTELERLDGLFCSASHNYYMLRQARDEAPEHVEYHQMWLGYSLRGLMNLVASGDFSEAIDPSISGLDDPDEGWNADLCSCPIPLEHMFGQMTPDARYPLGCPHPGQALVRIFRSPVAKSCDIPVGTWRVRLIASA